MTTEADIVYLREVDPNTPNACWVVCSKGDPGAVEFSPARSEPPIAGGGVDAGLRPEVLAFAHLMEAKLRENDHKGGWNDCQPHELLKRLREETVEVEQALNSQREHEWEPWDPVTEPDKIGWRKEVRAADGGRFLIRPLSLELERMNPTPEWQEQVGHEAADVANFAMMIADVCGALAAPPPEHLVSGGEKLNDEPSRTNQDRPAQPPTSDAAAALFGARWACARCGRDAEDARQHGCSRGPCPMDLIDGR